MIPDERLQPKTQSRLPVAAVRFCTLSKLEVKTHLKVTVSAVFAQVMLCCSQAVFLSPTWVGGASGGRGSQVATDFPALPALP